MSAPARTAGGFRVAGGSRVVMTTCPAGPAGHRSSRSAGSHRSSRISAHGRSVWDSQATKRAAAASAPASGSPAPTAPAAWAKLTRTASRLVALTQTITSTAPELRSPCANSTASCVLPVPPWAAGAVAVCSPWVRTTVCPGNRPDLRSTPVSGRWKYQSVSGGTLPDRSIPGCGGAPARCCATTLTAPQAMIWRSAGRPGPAAPGCWRCERTPNVFGRPRLRATPGWLPERKRS